MTGNRLNDLLALSLVPRWSIVDHSRQQYVSDHTFRVLVIALELTDRLELPALSRKAMMEILCHDADESRTGDIPAIVKRDGSVLVYPVHCPWLHAQHISEDERKVIALADIVEALSFIRMYGAGAHAGRVRDLLTNTIKGTFSPELAKVALDVANDIYNEEGR
jgi:hypothetical protein